MRTHQNEIIEDVLEHIRQTGGETSEWWVGTAKDLAACFPRQGAPGPAKPPAAAESAPGLICREAYTAYAAAEVVERLEGCGLRPDRESRRGDLVYVYRPKAAFSTPLSAASHRAP